MPSSEQQQFTILNKSKLKIKGEKINRKVNLRNTNQQKVLIQSDIDEQGQGQQLKAKKKAKKWWNKIDKKYFSILTIQEGKDIIEKIQQIPITTDKLDNYFEQQFHDLNHELINNNTIRVLFRRQVTMNNIEDNCIVFYELRNDFKLNFSNNNQIILIEKNIQEKIEQNQDDTQNIQFNGQQINNLTQFNKQCITPQNIHIWSFKNPIKQIKPNIDPNLTNKKINGINLRAASYQNSTEIIQQLLRFQIQQKQSLDRQITLWTNQYYKNYQKNINHLYQLTKKIENNVHKKKLEEQLKQKQKEIVQYVQGQLLWSQILLLFKNGHSDKTQQLLNEAQQIRLIKQNNFVQKEKKKKSKNQTQTEKQKQKQRQKMLTLFQTDCKICFCTQCDQKINKVFYCDGCNTSFHQTCYGITNQEQKQLKDKYFFCDVCLYMNSLVGRTIGLKGSITSSKSILLEKLDNKLDSKTKKPSCQLCCKPNFPMKFIQGHFYHVTCLFMFQLAEVKNAKIFLKQNITHEQIITTVTLNQIYSQPCQFCLKGSGMKYKCYLKNCNKWYHPICAYLNGTFFQIQRQFRSLDVKIICNQHISERDFMKQIFVRRFFCDYKKTSKLTEQQFHEQYAKQIKQFTKQKGKLFKNDNLLLRKFKNIKAHLLKQIIHNDYINNPSSNGGQSNQRIRIIQGCQQLNENQQIQNDNQNTETKNPNFQNQEFSF